MYRKCLYINNCDSSYFLIISERQKIEGKCILEKTMQKTLHCGLGNCKDAFWWDHSSPLGLSSLLSFPGGFLCSKVYQLYVLSNKNVDRS